MIRVRSSFGTSDLLHCKHIAHLTTPTQGGRSTYPFCQGERNEVGRSRIPIARTRALNAAPNA
jgi:hypothetical protein